ncbi:MAG: three-Cys-motif partner protein TcmP [Acidobacteria bacterium]|nr:three-Cys-motif partner protein TcmP [Acidobacteriota bacterium]
MSIRTTRWELPPHTKIKHEILKRYLDAWLPILGSWSGRIVFIDGFAGPGRYSGGEPGSPVIALRALLGHPAFQKVCPGRTVVFFFIEQDKERAAALREEVAVLPRPQWVTVAIEEGEFAGHMTQVLNAITAGGKQLAPTFAFIDPFGIKDLPMALVARIVRHPSCECLISFMYETINRFLAHPGSEIQAQYDELFGTKEWRAIVALIDPEIRKDRLVSLYRDQLRRVAGLTYVRTLEMINQGNRTEYFLFFGTNNKRGLSKMKEAMWRADPVAGQVFSDRSVSGQGVLFEPQADVAILRRQLEERFRGQGWVAVEEVADFVLEETAYSEIIHLKRATLAPMENEGVLAAQGPPETRRRRGTFPGGTKVRFL